MGMVVGSSLAFAQTPSPDPQQVPPPEQSTSSSNNGGWRRIGESNPAPAPMPPPAATTAPQNSQPPQGSPPPAPAGLPPQLTIKPGTYVTVRLNQPLSSNKNQVGDAFSATLVRPLIVDGIVVAERGQTLGGRVSEAQKAGRVEGVSKLGIQLTDLPIVDGQQVPIQTQFISRTGPTSVGRDAGAIAGTTAVGAAIGAGVGWGTGAAIGAGAGALVGTLGVLLTRGQPTIIYPESVMTFRVEQPVTISTDRAPQTFRQVEPGDYQQSTQPTLRTRGPVYGSPYGPGPGYYGAGYYPYPYYPYPYWGPAFYGGVYFGPRFGRRW